ncbi:hypothetical protein BD410DRAFT_831556 [Rickenella mellea]|uniref:Uncharacterized protein n=1 Tax=Rickenella mellea TaxID=50990 RepID=A0A4Y7PPP0_9AGAM|nr:hypothetical protein BD410DRAFT_831556 [Rickenella mellea]
MYAKSFILATILSASLVDAAPLTRRAGDFGSCSDPTIKFANGLDGRNEPAFAPNNAANFNHGSALNIGVIANFICGQLQSSCKADATANTACAAAEKAATGKTGQAAADAFNSAITGGASASAAAPAAAAPAASSPAAAGAPAASGGNLQTFTGTLGGLPPPVTAGGKGFIVDGSEFIQEGGALGRSCDVQHNACSNAANGGGSTFNVSACDTQNNACHAAI